MEENKKVSKKMPIILIVALLVILVVGAIIYLNNNNNPKNVFLGVINKVFDTSEVKTEEIKTVNATIGLGVNIKSQDEEIARVAEYINKAKLTLNTQLDLEAEKELVKLGVDYENSNVLDAQISYKNQEDNIYAKVEELFDKTFAIEIDEEMKETFKTLFNEVKALSKGDYQNSKNAVDILKDAITSRLKDEYFSQEDVDLDVNSEKINARKSILTLTPVQLKEILSGIVSELKNNEEFINCFDEEEKEEIKKALAKLETSVNKIDEGTSEQDKLVFNLYTKGTNNEFLKFEFIIIDDTDEVLISIVKNNKENYKLLVNEKIDGETSELLSCLLTVKVINDTTTDLTIKVNIEELGEVTINLQLSYVLNKPIESIDTKNSVNIDELTEKQKTEIMTNLEKMKIYTLVQDIYTSNYD